MAYHFLVLQVQTAYGVAVEAPYHEDQVHEEDHDASCDEEAAYRFRVPSYEAAYHDHALVVPSYVADDASYAKEDRGDQDQVVVHWIQDQEVVVLSYVAVPFLHQAFPAAVAVPVEFG